MYWNSHCEVDNRYEPKQPRVFTWTCPICDTFYNYATLQSICAGGKPSTFACRCGLRIEHGNNLGMFDYHVTQALKQLKVCDGLEG